mmetsp:Transcript_14068/g.50041  ORF Transcript_14068/g.50041 Transcript_14068/m.50041 type:complete len:289 (+) Transcript_14068:14-880(+)
MLRVKHHARCVARRARNRTATATYYAAAPWAGACCARWAWGDSWRRRARIRAACARTSTAAARSGAANCTTSTTCFAPFRGSRCTSWSGRSASGSKIESRRRRRRRAPTRPRASRRGGRWTRCRRRTSRASRCSRRVRSAWYIRPRTAAAPQRAAAAACSGTRARRRGRRTAPRGARRRHERRRTFAHGPTASSTPSSPRRASMRARTSSSARAVRQLIRSRTSADPAQPFPEHLKKLLARRTYTRANPERTLFARPPFRGARRASTSTRRFSRNVCHLRLHPSLAAL